MSKGFFRIYRDGSNTQDIVFQQIDLAEGETIPDDQLLLRDNVDSALTTIRLLFGDRPDRFELYFRPLLSLTQLGLVGPSANPALAQRALLSLQNEVVAKEGGTIKNGYMKKLGIYSLILALPPTALAISLQCLGTSELVGYLFLWSGCMAGVWLSFGTRKVIINFDELGILEKDRLSPAIRLIFAGLLTIVIGLFIATGVVALELGGLSATEFVTDSKAALLIGALCGISELALSTSVSQNATKLLGLDRST